MAETAWRVRTGGWFTLAGKAFGVFSHPLSFFYPSDRFSADYWARIGLGMGAAASAGANDAAYTKEQLEVRRKWRRVRA